jgi:hypothetical protein
MEQLGLGEIEWRIRKISESDRKVCAAQPLAFYHDRGVADYSGVVTTCISAGGIFQ